MSRFFFYRKSIFLFLLGTTLFLGAGLRYLHVDYSPQYVFKSHSQQFSELEDYIKTFGKEDHVLILMFEGEGLFSQKSISYFQNLGPKLEKIPGIKTRSPFTFFPKNLSPEELKKRALGQFWMRRLFISEEGDLVAFFVDIDPNVEKVDELLPLIARVEQELARSPAPGLKLHITGIPYVRKQIVMKLIEDQLIFLPLCTFLFLGILYFLFRQWSLVLIPLGSIAMALVWTLGLMGWMGKDIDILNNVLPTLIFIIAISDSIHLISRYLQEVAAGKSQEESLQITLRHLKVACFFTSFTTAVGFGSLMVAEVDIMRSFGLYCALGVLFAYITTMLFIPTAIYCFWAPSRKEVSGSASWKMTGLSDWILINPLKILAVAIFILAGAGYLGWGVKVNNYLLESVSAKDPIYIASKLAEKKLCGMIPMAVVFKGDTVEALPNPEVFRAMDEMAHFLRKQPGIRYVLSPADFIKEANFAIAFVGNRKREIPQDKKKLQILMGAIDQFQGKIWRKFYLTDKRQARLHAFGADGGAREALVFLKDLEQKIQKYKIPGVRITTSDVAPVAAPALQKLVGDMRESLFWAFGIIFVTMTLLFGSLRIGLVSIVPNIAPMIFAVGALGIAGLELQITTIFVFPIALGLAVDDTIHFLARYQEALNKGCSIPEAIKDTFTGAGKAICFTTLLLGLGFAVVLFSNFPITQRFAGLMEVIILVALASDLFLLPACILLFKVGKNRNPLPEATECSEVAVEAE